MKGETEWNRLNYKWLPESVHGLWFFDPSLKLSAALQRLITLELFAKIYYYHEAQGSRKHFWNHIWIIAQSTMSPDMFDS